MQVLTTWKEKMLFVSSCDGHEVSQDAKSPIGDGRAMTPKELVVVGLTGCTAMDVAALMKKHKQPVEQFEVDAAVELSKGKYPVVFESVLLNFRLKGQVDKDKVIEAVHLSQTKYCGVSAMLSKAVAIHYKVTINNEVVTEGQADFSG